MMLSIKIRDYQFTLAVIYSPNNDCPSFFSNIQQNIESLGNSSVIISGDWNVPQDYMKDTINYVHRSNEKSQKQIHQMMEFLDLVDTYRELHPEFKRYSWRGSHIKQVRLDYFLTSSDFQAFITEADIDVLYRSDHSPVYIELNFCEHRRIKGTWKLNNSFLYDKEYINIVKECIKDVINQYKCDDCENLFKARFNIDDQLLWETYKLITISYSSFKKKERDKKENDLENTLKNYSWDRKMILRN
jgi:hypothetical protein